MASSHCGRKRVGASRWKPAAAESCTCCASVCLCVRASSGAIRGQIKGRMRTKANADSHWRASWSLPVWSERCFDVDLERARSSLSPLALLSPWRTVPFSSVTVNLGHLRDDGEAINTAFTAAMPHYLSQRPRGVRLLVTGSLQPMK